MKGRINLDYEYSPDPYNRHFALYLYLERSDGCTDQDCAHSPNWSGLSSYQLPEFHNLTNSLSYIHLFRELAWWKAASIWTMSTALIRTTVTALSISICLRRRWQATTHVKYLPFRMTWQPRKGWPSTVSKRILADLITIDLCLISEKVRSRFCLFVTEEILITVSRQAPDKEAS